MAEPSIGDSKKKGIVTIAIVSLVAMKPQTWMDIAIVIGVVLIAITGILVFAFLEKGKKDLTEPPKSVQ